MPMTRYWLFTSGATEGPFDLAALAATPGFSPEAQVCIEGGAEWLRAADVPFLAAPF